MGERKGQNHYYPPDFDYKVHKSLAGYHGQHPLRERARKMDQGILIIRFEMPYNIWCDGCNAHIGMGVRYNAEKSKIGMYYTTPLYQFRMKCHLCNNHFVIKTDPSKHDYVITSGARRKEQRWDPHENGQIVPEDRETQKKLVLDSMYKLEHGVDDVSKGKSKVTHLVSLLEHRQLRGRHDHLANQIARQQMRAAKQKLAESQAKDDSLKERLSLNIDLLAETEDDSYRAHMMTYAVQSSFDERKKEIREEILKRPLFSRKSHKKPETTTRGSTVRDVNIARSLRIAADKKRPFALPQKSGPSFGIKAKGRGKKSRLASEAYKDDTDSTNVKTNDVESVENGQAFVQKQIINDIEIDAVDVATNQVEDCSGKCDDLTNQASTSDELPALNAIFCNYASSTSSISDSD